MLTGLAEVPPICFQNNGHLAIAARGELPSALSTIRDWLQPPAHPDNLVHRLHEADLYGRFPKQALNFLSLVIGDQTQWPLSDLEGCLDAIRTAEP